MGIYRFRILFDIGVPGELAGSGFHLQYTNDSQEASQVPMHTDAVWDWWDIGAGGSSEAQGNWPSTVKLHTVTGQRVSPTIGPVYTDARTPVAGTRVGDPESPQVTIVASFRTNVSSRRQRGRMYLPPPSQADVGPTGLLVGTMAQDTASLVMSLFQELESPARLDPGTGPVEHVIWSARAAGQPATAYTVTRYLVGNRVDTQRRRLGREQTYSQGV